MNRTLLVLILPSFLVFAEERRCSPAPPSSMIDVSLKKGTKLKELAAWYHQVTCRDIEAPLSAADAPSALTVEGKLPAARVLDVVRAVAGSAGYEVRDDVRKLSLQKAPEPCDPAKVSAVLARVNKGASCALDLEGLGAGDCADTRVSLDEAGGKLKIAQLQAGSLLHAIGLREGDELVDDRAALFAVTPVPSFELKVLRAGAPKTVRCEISGSGRLHPATILREALGPPPDSCAIDPSAITTKGDTVEVVAAKAPGLDFNCLTRASRIVPAMRDGKVFGFKVYAIRPNTLLALLGFQNGDTVQTINGRELDSPDKALEVYTALRNEKKFSVAIERRGTPMTLTIVLK